MTEVQKALADLRCPKHDAHSLGECICEWAASYRRLLHDAKAEREPVVTPENPLRVVCAMTTPHYHDCIEREPVGEHEPDLPLMEAEGDLCRVCGGEELAPQHRLAIIRILRESLDRRLSRAAEVEAPSDEQIASAWEGLESDSDYSFEPTPERKAAIDRIRALFAQAPRAEVSEAVRAAFTHAWKCTDPESCIEDLPGREPIGCIDAVLAALQVRP